MKKFMELLNLPSNEETSKEFSLLVVNIKLLWGGEDKIVYHTILIPQFLILRDQDKRIFFSLYKGFYHKDEFCNNHRKNRTGTRKIQEICEVGT